MQTKVFVLWEQGDDYHGSGVVAVYENKEEAKEAAKKQPRVCGACGFSPIYSVSEVEYHAKPKDQSEDQESGTRN